MARLKYEDVKDYVENNSKCKLLSTEYINNNTKMLFRCECGREFEMVYRNFKYKNIQSCEVCNGHKYDYRYVKEYIEKNSDCRLLSTEYKGIDNKIKLLCSCGNEFEVSFSHFVRSGGRQCNKCGHENGAKIRRKTLKEFTQEVYNLVGDEYIVLDNYINTNTPILFKHNKCNHEFYMRPADFLTGQRCPKCRWIGQKEKMTKTHETFISEMKEKYNDEYTILGQYQTARIKIKTRHNTCGHVWDVVPDSLLRGYGCPRCASSKGEKSIGGYLESNNIEFISEYKFEECKVKRPLPFDFYLPGYNLLIEYDGEQHFEPKTFGGISDDKAKLNFKRTKKHDKIKNTYCIKNNIKLVRIPYWDFDNIDQILDEVLFEKDSAYFIA